MGIEEIAKSNFSEWAEALKTKDPKIMAEFYSEDATFLPTFSPDLKIGSKEAEGYFEHFMLKFPLAEIKGEVVRNLGENFYLHTGMYDFEIGPDEKREMAQARFSYIWEKYPNGKWKIIHHHSSPLPQ
jgi:uncharacterized protein (TIGR02246 family)